MFMQEAKDKYIFETNFKRCIFPDKNNMPKSLSSIIMLSNDLENLNFYYNNIENLNSGTTYIQVEKIDTTEIIDANLRFFSETTQIAKMFWKEHNLIKYMTDNELHVKIAIVGFDILGQKILNYGLMNNIYDEYQRIEYHIWGDSSIYEKMYADFKFMNADSIFYHGEDWKKDLLEFKKYERVIITQEHNIELLQSLLYICPTKEIFFYAKDDTCLDEIFKHENLIFFGRRKDVITTENLFGQEQVTRKIHDELYQKWISRDAWNYMPDVNRETMRNYVSYIEMCQMILSAQKKDISNFTEDEKRWINKADHINWCRRMFLKHWSWGPERDNQERLHPMLCSFEEIEQTQKLQDFSNVLQSVTELNKR